MKKFYLILSLCCLFSIIGLRAQDNYTIYGKISCSGVGMEGVVVSDGYNFTQTDANGNYYINSDKKNGYVFYVIPSGYMPYTGASSTTEEKIFPPFWQSLNYPNTPTRVEKHDFKLKVENNDKHIMFFQADPQVASRESNDYNQYTTLYFPRTKKEISDAGSTPIYTTVLGDLSWDNFWYANGYDIASYRITLVNNYNSFKMKHFHVIGNHDHNGATPESDETDFKASGRFRQVMGPNCYSYNIGKIHYVSLEIIVSTVLGIILGLILGSALSYRVILLLESIALHFMRNIQLGSWAIAALITVLFTFLVSWWALRKVKNLNLTDINN